MTSHASDEPRAGEGGESAPRQQPVLPALAREVMRPTSDRGRLAALATICSLAGVALGFALAGTMFASIPVATRVAYPAQVRCPVDTPAWIGVGIRSDGPTAGAWVRTIQPGSPAAGIDLRPGDVITAIDDRQVDSADELILSVRSRTAGSQVSLQVQRGELRLDRQVVLESMPRAIWHAERRGATGR